jgi:Rod binding domain-containing protein
MDELLPLLSQDPRALARAGPSALARAGASALARAGATPRPGDADAAREFEGYLLRVVLDEMRRSVTSGGLFDGRATRGYQLMLDEALTRQMAQRGGLGLATQLLEQWEQQR